MPLKSVECLRDLKLMYEAATVEDIYDAYDQAREREWVRSVWLQRGW